MNGSRIIGWRTMIVLLTGIMSIAALAWRGPVDEKTLTAIVLLAGGQAVSSYLKAKNGNGKVNGEGSS